MSNPVANITGYLLKTDNGKRHVTYNISIVLSDHQWNINRRYSEFVHLNKQISQIKSNLPKLPSKVIFHRNLSVIETRKASFQLYLNALLENPELVNHPTVQKFLCIPTSFHNEGKSNFNAIESTDHSNKTYNSLSTLSKGIENEKKNKVGSDSKNDLKNELHDHSPHSHSHSSNDLSSSKGSNELDDQNGEFYGTFNLSRRSIDLRQKINIFGSGEFIDVPCFESKAIEAYNPSHFSELSIIPNEPLLIYVQGENWSLGSKVNSTNKVTFGFVPSSTIESEDHSISRNQISSTIQNNRKSFTMNSRTATPKSNNLTTVLYDYIPLQEDEIAVTSSELVQILQEDEATDRFEIEKVDRGSIELGKRIRGWIPCDYVEKLRIVRRRESLLIV